MKITASTTNRITVGGGAGLGSFAGSNAALMGCGMPVVGTYAVADTIGAVKLGHPVTAELRAPIFGGQVWLRPAATDVLVPTTGHPAWSPPT